MIKFFVLKVVTFHLDFFLHFNFLIFEVLFLELKPTNRGIIFKGINIFLSILLRLYRFTSVIFSILEVIFQFFLAFISTLPTLSNFMCFA
jgi:hypothetical protein